MIDFVVPWVDDSDPIWRKKKAEYLGIEPTEGNSEVRYRDWDTLKYWFRGVEKFAPWVRYVYFVTDDQKPEWLNVNHPKLKWTKHTDFIPEEYLPTFNSNNIEMFFHNIKELSDNYILCNDDTFFFNRFDREFFFRGNIPVQCVTELLSISNNDDFLKTVYNNYKLLCDIFPDKKNIYRHYHVQTPHKKYLEKYLVDKYKDKILNGFDSKFRSVNNYTM